MRRALCLTALVLAASPATAKAQGTADSPAQEVDAYFRAVGEYFGVADSEIDILREWELPPDEIPVVLFVAGRVGVSPEALVGLRRSGDGWGEIVSRYGLGAEVLHVPIPEGAPAGRLQELYELLESTPVSQWGTVALDADAVVALVNLRFLVHVSGLASEEVLRRLGPNLGFVELYVILATNRGEVEGEAGTAGLVPRP